MLLKDASPEIYTQIDPTKNADIEIEKLKAQSNIDLFWQCDKGHSWHAKVCSRMRGTKCPYCQHRAVLPGFNDLASTFPEVAGELHPTKNGALIADTIFPYSNQNLWWECSRGHEWKATVNNRTRGKGCPYCFKERFAFSENNLMARYPEIAREWHPTKNGELKPSDVSARSRKIVWWRCSYGHEWQDTVLNRTVRGANCPYDLGKRLAFLENNLATKYPEIAKEWHPTKNGELHPSDVAAHSHKNAWWICEKGHVWQATVLNRTSNGTDCPYCSGRLAISGTNDLQTLYPNIAEEWCKELNEELDPSNFLPKSGKSVWWECSENHNHRWKATILSRIALETGCPYCSGRKSDLGVIN